MKITVSGGVVQSVECTHPEEVAVMVYDEDDIETGGEIPDSFDYPVEKMSE